MRNILRSPDFECRNFKADRPIDGCTVMRSCG
jgi:hypothetical protein